MAGLRWDWVSSPEFGDLGWLVMDTGGTVQYQNPRFEVLLTQMQTDDGVRWQVNAVGNVLDGATYPTAAVAVFAVHLHNEEVDDG